MVVSITNQNISKSLDIDKDKDKDIDKNKDIKTFEHNSNTITIVIIMFVLTLMGIIGIRILDSIYYGTQYSDIVRMFGITILLNVMILVFLVISFKRIHFSRGPIGPKGNRGLKGYKGVESTLNSCNKNTSILKSGQKKYNIRKKEVSFARYPAIIDE
jgi:hypothetical protein